MFFVVVARFLCPQELGALFAGNSFVAGGPPWPAGMLCFAVPPLLFWKQAFALCLGILVRWGRSVLLGADFASAGELSARNRLFRAVAPVYRFVAMFALCPLDFVMVCIVWAEAAFLYAFARGASSVVGASAFYRLCLVG